jgi:hypothetical protein
VDVLEQHWTDLQDEYAKKCGVDGMAGHYMEKTIEYYKLMQKEIIYGCEEYNSKLSKIKTKRKLLERELDDMPVVEQTLEDKAIQLEIFFNRDFDTRTTSVLRWHKYLKEYERRVEELQRSQKDGA